MNIFTKQIDVPASNEMKTIEVAQLWTVRWNSRHGEYSPDTRPEVESFINEGDAESFKQSLINANKILKNTNESSRLITIMKSE